MSGVLLESDGNAWLRPVTVIALHTPATEVFTIGNGHAAVGAGAGEYRPPQGTGSQFEGGSGRNWRLKEVSAGSAPAVPLGAFRSAAPDTWTSAREGEWTWNRDPGTGVFSLHDGTDTVAETAGPVSALTGVASAGTYPVTDWNPDGYYPGFGAYYQAVGYPLWTMFHDFVSGDVTIAFAGSPEIVRTGGSTTDPSGVFTVSAQMEIDYNGGAPWTYTVAAGGLSATAIATPYGEATYGAAATFDIEAEFEGGLEFPTQKALVRAAGSTAQEGLYTPTAWQEWTSDDDSAWKVTVDGTGAGEWSDGTDVVATRAADANRLYDPSGGWELTAYGRATYGAAEDTTAGTVSAGTFPEQEWALVATAGTVEFWQGATDALKSIELDTVSGDALLKDGTDTVGERLGGSTASPDGIYDSTVYGADTYGSGGAWTYTVVTTSAGADFPIEAGLDRAVPVEGWWWVELDVDTGNGEILDVRGPFFGASFPDNDVDLAVIPVGHSDGAGVVTDLLGGAPVIWRP